MRLIFLFVYLPFSLVNAEVYKTIDEDGNIIFTDRPTVDSEQIKLKELKTTETVRPSDTTSNRKSQSEKDEDSNYKKISITSPIDGSAVRSNSGNVRISVSIDPALRSGHRVLITLDGVELSKGTSMSASVDNLDRGTHTTVASIIDSSSKPIISISSSFSILRASQ
tara:strand:- start:241 stop:741 length:501 start_codon:yes stop_codon:yes gene_type:complete